MPKNNSANFDVIGIPMGTRLQSVVLQNGEVHIWIAVKSMTGVPATWVGTYLRVEPNGKVTRVTTGEFEDEFVIKGENK